MGVEHMKTWVKPPVTDGKAPGPAAQGAAPAVASPSKSGALRKPSGSAEGGQSQGDRNNKNSLKGSREKCYLPSGGSSRINGCIIGLSPERADRCY